MPLGQHLQSAQGRGVILAETTAADYLTGIRISRRQQMLKGLGQMGDMAKMMEAAQEMQSKMAQLQGNMQNQIVIGQSGAGLVKASCTVKGELKSLDIDPSIFSSDDIQKQLPTESKRFRTVDKNWRRSMTNANKSRDPVAICGSDKQLKTFQEGKYNAVDNYR